MEEIWETIKSTGKKIKYNTDISNKGNVRIVSYYKDKEIKTYHLSLGKGLYISKYKEGYSISIANCYGDIYRYVYFMQYTGHKYIKCWQIHHIDYNHCNNSIENLLYCSPKEHGLYHFFQFKLGNEIQGYQQQWTDIEIKQLEDYNKTKEYYKWLETNKTNFSIDKAKQYIKDIHKDTESIIKKQLQDIKEQKYLDKLNSGKYIEVDGKLVRVKTKRVISDYQKQRMAEGRRRKCYNNSEWRDKCRNGLLRYLQENNGHYRKSGENHEI